VIGGWILLSVAKKMDLFYILKLNVGTILNQNNNINITFEEAKKQGCVVSIGDNQILKFIREIKFIDFEKQRFRLEQLYKERNLLKSMPKCFENSEKIAEYQKQIDDILYVPDLITVHADTTKKAYIGLCKTGFIVNGIKFRRLCAGSGQLRRNNVLFVNENFYSQLEERMLCGLNKKRIGKINLAKFSAYYSLYSSSTNFISTPRVCVVKDYEVILKNQEVEWIYTKENGERDIEKHTIDIKTNVWDGSGLVSVEMAKQWQNDLKLDYTPSAFIVRSAWIKGLCVVFDWKRFAKEVAKKEYIIDAWGKKKHIDDIDVILTTSQFKMWKKYKDWEEYLEYHTKYGHIWGCSRVNKKYDNTYTALNYQYIQSNFFSDEDIKSLAEFSIDWVKKVCTGDKIYVLLYLLGSQDADKSIEEIEKSTGMNIAKALMYSDEILKDDYVRNRIYKSIEKRIKQLKVGKLLIEGSYEFAIVDPYGFCEYVFGMEVNGLLKAGQFWQKRWVDKGSKEVAVFRSPLVAPNENQVLEVYSDDKCLKWYSNINSGVVLNIWDTTLMRASDGDTDGDLLLTTDNKYIVKSVDKTLPPITYDKATVKEQTLTDTNFAKMDARSFNTKIGFITNLATSFFCLREQYDENSEEYKELTRRINLLRFHQGSAIDAGKGNVYIAPPSYWYRKQKIDYKNDTPEEIQRKQFYNKLCGDKKSYFMCYIYPALLKKYKQYKKSAERMCKVNFGCKINELLVKENKTQEEKRFISNYYKYIPVFTNNSTMNKLCRLVEDVDFDLRFYKTKENFDYTVMMNDNIKIDTESNMYKRIYEVIKNHYKTYKETKSHINNIIENFDFYDFNEEDDESNEILNLYFDELENNLYKICSNKVELCNCVVDVLYKKFKDKPKSFLWCLFGDIIVDNLKKKTNTGYIPTEIEQNLGFEYLGKYYQLTEVSVDDNI
jgi:hypothetical protein